MKRTPKTQRVIILNKQTISALNNSGGGHNVVERENGAQSGMGGQHDGGCGGGTNLCTKVNGDCPNGTGTCGCQQPGISGFLPGQAPTDLHSLCADYCAGGAVGGHVVIGGLTCTHYETGCEIIGGYVTVLGDGEWNSPAGGESGQVVCAENQTWHVLGDCNIAHNTYAFDEDCHKQEDYPLTYGKEGRDCYGNHGNSDVCNYHTRQELCITNGKEGCLTFGYGC